MNPTFGTTVDPEKAAERAHVLLESEITARLDAVRDLAKRLNDLDTAIADYLAAWQTAQRAGWTEGTLSDIGLRAPESLPAPSGRRSVDSAEAGAPAAPATSSSPALAPVVALTPPPAHVPSPVVSAPAFGQSPTLGSVSSLPTGSSSVVTTPSH
ncbi:hypothetical protein ACFQ9V_05405 [Leifsonia sp. NPDC056665]|uniref:hypothetical protein n=1 Tax=Leifsonia sp. NPDC056665 TaxID=3345901 RepID=UPI0036D1191F